MQFEQDHKVPRLRKGGDELDNWQPLCTECNNFKSTACRGCSYDCQSCGWAFPETYAPLRLIGDNTVGLRRLAREKGVNPHDLLNEVVAAYLKDARPQ